MRLLVLALLAAGCAAPDAPDAGPDLSADTPAARVANPDTSTVTPADFDAAAWLAEARPLSGVTWSDSLGNEDPRYPDALALTARLPLGWERACDTYEDYDTGEMVYEPTEPGGGHGLRGTLEVADLPGGEAVVGVVCNFGAYQGSYALVHVAGSRAALLRAPALDENSQPTDRPWPVFSTPRFEPGSATFSTLGLARGLGDCGTFARHRIAGLGRVETVEVQAQECRVDADPHSAPQAGDWPVVYSAP